MENDVEGMNSELVNASTRCAKLIDEILSREEVLALLQQDARLVMEGKEQSEVECKVLRMEAKALADRISGLVRVEGEKKEALRLMKEVADERDKMAKEMQCGLRSVRPVRWRQ